MRGRTSPKVMAMMIRNAVAPFATMIVKRTIGACGVVATNSTGPVAALDRKKPGINKRTAEKATAAKGKCKRFATGVAKSLASTQTMSAPVAALRNRHRFGVVERTIRALESEAALKMPERRFAGRQPGVERLSKRAWIISNVRSQHTLKPIGSGFEHN